MLFFLKLIFKYFKNMPETMEIICDKRESNRRFYKVDGTAPDEKNVFLVGSLASYSNSLTSIGTLLFKQGWKPYYFVPQNIMKQIKSSVQNSPVVTLPLEDFISLENIEKFKERVQYRNLNWETVKACIRTDKSELLKDLYTILPDQVKYIETDVMAQMEVYSEMAGSLMDSAKPRAIFLSRIRRLTEEVFASEAIKRKIPVIVANHGHIAKNWTPQTLGHIDKYASYFFVWNQEQKNTLSALFPDFPLSNICISGGIHWDIPIKKFAETKRKEKELRKLKARILEAVFYAENVPDTSKLIITITIDDHIRDHLKNILQILKKMEDIVVLIKTRPGESKEFYKKYYHTLNIPVGVVDFSIKADLFEIFAVSNLVFTSISSTNFDALALATPVVTISFSDKIFQDDRRPGLEKFGLPVARSIKQLKKFLADWSKTAEVEKKWIKSAEKAARHFIHNYPEGNACKKFLEKLS